MIDHDNLEEFSDPVNYDREDSNGAGVAFYSALAKESGGPVLEIACGTGRVSIPIARLGFAVTGLDIVPGMLQMARSKSAGLAARWVEGDGRTFELGEQWGLDSRATDGRQQEHHRGRPQTRLAGMTAVPFLFKP